MPVVNKSISMAECVNYGLGNEELPPIMSPGPMFAEMILRGMQDLKCVDLKSLPSQKEDCPQQTNDDEHEDSNDLESSPVHDSLANVIPKDCLDDNSSTEEDYPKCPSLMSLRTVSLSASTETTQVPSDESLLYFLPANYNKRNLWRRVSGFHTAGNELRSATYPARSSIKKLRFAQAKKPLNYLYSYFSIQISDCDETSGITIGVTRKDYPCRNTPGKAAGSIGYFSDTGSIFLRDSIHLEGPQYSKGDVIGCGIIYPSHYKKYADLSTDDNSDGMTDVVLTSMLNKKSMDFVCNVLNLNVRSPDHVPSNFEEDSVAHNDTEESNTKTGNEESDYYNENFVESRTQVEVYFTYNMQVIGKVLTHIPMNGFYPTVHMLSNSAILMSVDLNPPTS